jgi:hypothetical protein
MVDCELKGAFLICDGSLVGRSLLIRDRELVFLTQVLLGFFDVSSNKSGVEWWANLIVCSKKSLSAAFLNSVGGDGKLIVVDFSLGVLVYFYFYFLCNTCDLIPYLYMISFAIQKKKNHYLRISIDLKM